MQEEVQIHSRASMHHPERSPTFAAAFINSETTITTPQNRRLHKWRFKTPSSNDTLPTVRKRPSTPMIGWFLLGDRGHVRYSLHALVREHRRDAGRTFAANRSAPIIFGSDPCR